MGQPMEACVTTPLQDERFLMLEALGRGGMGTVYRAFDRTEQRLVALKVPYEKTPAGPAHPLSEEFDRWTQLEHPNIVRAYELGHAERGPLARGTPYLVLEHVRGRPAHQVFPAGRMNGTSAPSSRRATTSTLSAVPSPRPVTE